MNSQALLFADYNSDQIPVRRHYSPALTVTLNHKGCVDVDTIKGCRLGMLAYPDGGCYGECYARKIAERSGIDFSVSTIRTFVDHREHRDLLIKKLMDAGRSWYRIGVMGDPCHDWNNTINVCRALKPAGKVAIIVTKHWIALTDDQISRLFELNVVIHTSTSGMDSNQEIAYRVRQLERLRRYRIPCVNRVVTCKYGDSEWARDCEEKQRYLLSLMPIIDNPLRVSRDNRHVRCGEIVITKRLDSIGGGKRVSLHSPNLYLGHCDLCPDQCRIELASNPYHGKKPMEDMLFDIRTDGEKAEFKYVPSVIGSGFEADVANLALEDGIAHRAARKNMQIHSAIILLIDGRFSGFFTFQNNKDVGEFCLLQSVIKPKFYTPALYKKLVIEVIKRNINNYPMLMTTNPKSKFETPQVFNELGFKTYLAMSGFEYMLAGDPQYYRMKVLAHITMTNVWDSTKDKWIKMKKEWNTHIAEAGIKHNIPNPAFATREGAWQGESGFANVVTGRSHNANASVLDPVACEVMLRFFTPIKDIRVYNPFGGGVQFGYVAGASGYEYVASEIRQNQCDANNALCSEFKNVCWICADSAKYEPDGMFDLVFTCPPYFKIERYVDYDGKSPEGEINSMATYEEFREALFAGYRIGINHLRDNRFFVVMTGDSRDSRGAYYCHEAETEIFLKNQGLSIYNKIIFLEAEFTRLAQAKKTLNMRKFPKREQRIIVAYKGRIDAIKDEFAPIGRL